MSELQFSPLQTAFREHVEAWREAESINCTSLAELKTVFNKWLYLEPNDSDFIDVALAALLDREIPGDPVWLYLVAPPGGLKSEVLRSFRVYPRAYTLDTLTASTFVSGMAEKDKGTGEMVPVAGILQDLDGKTVVVKDLTTLLNSAEEGRNEIYGQLRSIYDGFYEKAFGSIRRKVSVQATIGLVAGVTPVIDKYSAMHSVLGERFLKIRSNPDKWKAATRALQNEGREQLMRQELENAVKTFIQSLNFDVVPELTEEQTRDILRMAMYVAFMRSNVWSTYENGQIIDMEVINSEVPTRIAKQFKHLVKLLAIIRGHPEAVDSRDIDTLARVARDTAEQKKQAIIDYYVKEGLDGDYDPNDMAANVKGIYRSNVRNHLNILSELECVEPGRIGYRLTEGFKSYVRAAHRIPIPLSQTSLQNNPNLGSFCKQAGGEDISHDDILGTVAEYFNRVGQNKAIIQDLTDFVRRRHEISSEEFLEILKAYPSLFEVDGWTATLKE